MAAIATLLSLTSALTPKVAVVGPTGKVGRMVVQRLVKNGYTARVLLRHSPAGVAPSSSGDASPTAVAAWLSALDGVETVQGDVTDAPSLAVLMDGYRPGPNQHSRWERRRTLTSPTATASAQVHRVPGDARRAPHTEDQGPLA